MQNGSGGDLLIYEIMTSCLENERLGQTSGV